MKKLGLLLFLGLGLFMTSCNESTDAAAVVEGTEEVAGEMKCEAGKCGGEGKCADMKSSCEKGSNKDCSSKCDSTKACKTPCDSTKSCKTSCDSTKTCKTPCDSTKACSKDAAAEGKCADMKCESGKCGK